MAQSGSKVGITERISTLKGWAKQALGETPLTPKPAVAKTRVKRKFKR